MYSVFNVDLFVIVFLGFSGAMGLIAVISPKWFKRIATLSSFWVDSRKLLNFLDRRIDIDQRVLRHSRVFGLFVLASVAVLTFIYSNR